MCCSLCILSWMGEHRGTTWMQTTEGELDAVQWFYHQEESSPNKPTSRKHQAVNDRQEQQKTAEAGHKDTIRRGAGEGVGGVSQVAAGLVRSGNRCVDTFCVLAIWFLFNVLFSHLSFIHPLHSYDIWHTLSPNRDNQHFSICQSLPEEREKRWI